MRQDIDVAHYKALLEEKQAEVQSGLNSIMEGTFSESLKERTGEDSSYDQHSADLGLETFEREKDLGLKEGLETDRGRVERALHRLEQGEYGVCLSCGRPIPKGRLEAAPEAERCIECQEVQETAPRQTRPVEEDTPRLGTPGGFELLADDVNAQPRPGPKRRG